MSFVDANEIRAKKIFSLISDPLFRLTFGYAKEFPLTKNFREVNNYTKHLKIETVNIISERLQNRKKGIISHDINLIDSMLEGLPPGISKK